ncbi:hypothetical protein V1498_20490 [Peribacillus sp. SCS-26]|uniref:hypothetical protein n=1 Tax=Paraperibacillus marinus TaxID=3115295 RepID=UPI003905D75F
MYRRRKPPVLLIIALAVILLLLFYIRVLLSPGHAAESVVDDFYHYEARGDYGNSWALLHPSMKERWPKGVFMQDRVHVFIGHFGADTFDYSIEGGDKLRKWRAAPGLTLKSVYEFQVTQRYKGKYGTFRFVQDVYAVKEKGEWRVLWDYKE